MITSFLNFSQSAPDALGAGQEMNLRFGELRSTGTIRWMADVRLAREGLDWRVLLYAYSDKWVPHHVEELQLTPVHLAEQPPISVDLDGRPTSIRSGTQRCSPASSLADILHRDRLPLKPAHSWSAR